MKTEWGSRCSGIYRLVLYSKILDGGTFVRPVNTAERPIEWSDLVMMVEGIIENPVYRRKRIRSLRDR